MLKYDMSMDKSLLGKPAQPTVMSTIMVWYGTLYLTTPTPTVKTDFQEERGIIKQ